MDIISSLLYSRYLSSDFRYYVLYIRCLVVLEYHLILITYVLYFSAVVIQVSVLKNAPIASPKRKKGPIRFSQAQTQHLRPDQIAAVKAFMIPVDLKASPSPSSIHPVSTEKEILNTSSKKRAVEEDSTRTAKKTRI